MADTSIKLSGTYDSIEAYNILEEMREMSTDYEEIKEEAEAAASAATVAVTTAQTAANNASTCADNAQTYAGKANTSAGEAAGYASNASTSATNAATSETNASNSASAAATSESNAATSETNASDSATAAAASAAEVEAALDDYLPLAGGTMTGDLAIADKTLKVSDTTDNVDGYVKAYGWGTLITVDNEDYDQAGAKLTLNTKNANSVNGGINLGHFNLEASDGVNSKRFEGTPDGGLTWNNLRIGLRNGTYSLHFFSFGYITSSGTSLDMTFPYIVRGKDIRFNSITATLRSYKGYLSPGGSGTTDILTGSTQGTWYEKDRAYPCMFRLVRSSGWGTNGENNTVVVGSVTANVTVTDVV